MITLDARWLVVGLRWLTFAMGAASCAPVSDEPPPSPAEAASEAERNAVDLTQDSSSSGALEPADVAEIHDAARNGNVEKIWSLININADLANATDDQGNTPLMWAAEAGHKDVAELLLANKADVNAKNGIGSTPLSVAAGRGYTDLVELLLANGAEVNAKAQLGLTALYFAVTYGHVGAARALLANDANVNARGPKGRTPLHLAASGGHKEIVEFLLANQAAVDAKDSEGWSPLIGNYVLERTRHRLHIENQGVTP